MILVSKFQNNISLERYAYNEREERRRSETSDELGEHEHRAMTRIRRQRAANAEQYSAVGLSIDIAARFKSAGDFCSHPDALAPAFRTQ